MGSCIFQIVGLWDFPGGTPETIRVRGGERMRGVQNGSGRCVILTSRQQQWDVQFWGFSTSGLLSERERMSGCKRERGFRRTWRKVYEALRDWGFCYCTGWVAVDWNNPVMAVRHICVGFKSGRD